MDDGRPRPATTSQVLTAKPTTSRTVVIVASVLAVVAAGVAFALWTVTGSTAGVVTARLLSVLLATPLVLLLGSLVVTPGTGPSQRLSGWADPEIEITPWPVTLGTTMTVVYRRRPLNARTLGRLTAPPSVAAELVCREWVEYTVGTDTKTDTSDVARVELVAAAQPTGDGIESVQRIVIPVDAGAPTLDLPHNRITWRLDHRLGEPFGPRTATRVEIEVTPFLDRNAVLGEGGGGQGRLR